MIRPIRFLAIALLFCGCTTRSDKQSEQQVEVVELIANGYRQIGSKQKNQKVGMWLVFDRNNRLVFREFYCNEEVKDCAYQYEVEYFDTLGFLIKRETHAWNGTVRSEVFDSLKLFRFETRQLEESGASFPVARTFVEWNCGQCHSLNREMGLVGGALEAQIDTSDRAWQYKFVSDSEKLLAIQDIKMLEICSRIPKYCIHNFDTISPQFFDEIVDFLSQGENLK